MFCFLLIKIIIRVIGYSGLFACRLSPMCSITSRLTHGFHIPDGITPPTRGTTSGMHSYVLYIGVQSLHCVNYHDCCG